MKLQRRLGLVCLGWLTILVSLSWATLAFEDKPTADQPAAARPIPAAFQLRLNRTNGQLVAAGGSEESEAAVAAALNWLARHQNPDGGWGCAKFKDQCKDPSCTGHNKNEFGGFGGGDGDFPMAAASFALLPLLAGGQTHKTKGPYQVVITNGLLWITRNQDPKTGRLGGTMYEHGLATITLCEAYGLSGDEKLKPFAQSAVNYIQSAQHSEGGWRYAPNTPGDTSVGGWHFMGLMSAQLAGLDVDQQVLAKAKKFLKSVSKGKNGGLFSYVPESGPTPCMTSVGLLCSQHSGLKRNDPAMADGMNYLLANLPTSQKNCYYWYYATQVMHNLPGPEWEAWNNKLQTTVLSAQRKEGCASGSWSPEGHPHNAGPVMVTGLNTLNLQVYYRYAPLFAANDDKQNDPPKKD